MIPPVACDSHKEETVISSWRLAALPFAYLLSNYLCQTLQQGNMCTQWGGHILGFVTWLLASGFLIEHVLTGIFKVSWRPLGKRLKEWVLLFCKWLLLNKHVTESINNRKEPHLGIFSACWHQHRLSLYDSFILHGGRICLQWKKCASLCEVG